MKLQRIENLNKQFEENNWDGVVVNSVLTQRFFKIKDWKSPLMISAPHAVNHIREGEKIHSDILTWGLALYLSECFNLPIIYSTWCEVWDPNYDPYEISTYKQELKSYILNKNIKFLIDLHWCWSERDFIIELWTWWENHPNILWDEKLLEIIKWSLEQSFNTYIKHTKKEITVNTLFPAKNVNTISKFIAKELHIPALQIEINKELRDTKKEQMNILVSALENIIKGIEFYLIWD